MRVSLFLNHACNLRCRYCYNGRKFQRAMSWDVVERAVDLAFREPGERRVSFFGGEPLLEWDLVRRILTFCQEEAGRRATSVKHVLVTNATLLDDEKRRLLLDAGVFIGASLDGDREAHDATRRFRNGRGSFDRVVRNVGALVAERPGSKVIAVMDPTNVHRLGRSFDFLLDLGCQNLSMNLDYEADWENGGNLATFQAALHDLGDRYIAAYRAGRHFTLNILDSKVITHLKGGFAARDRCDFGCEEIAVSPRGRLYPCDRLVGQDDRDDVVIGDVWTGIDPVRRGALIAQKDTMAADCFGCALASRCMHWCGCVNHAMTGAVGGRSGLLCWFEQRIIEEADRCAGILFGEQNPHFVRRFYAPRLASRPQL